MKSTLLLSLLTLAAAVLPGRASPPATNATAVARVAELETELATVVRALRATPAAAAQRVELERARAELADTEAQLPGMAEVTRQLDALQDQAQTLAARRQAIRRAHRAELDRKQEALDAAQAAWDRTVLEDARVRALLTERRALQRQFEPAPVAGAEVAP